MVKRTRPLKVIIGLNFATSFITAILASLEGLVLILCAIGNATKGDGEWFFALQFLAVMAAIWAVSFLVTALVCRKRVVVTDSKLMVTKGHEVLFETPLEEITWLDYDFFAPITSPQIGEMLLAAKHPKPEGLNLYMGWISYKKIERRIRPFLDGKS